MKAESKQYYLVVLSMVLGLIILSIVLHDKVFEFTLRNKPRTVQLFVLIAFGFGFLSLAIPQLMIHVVKAIGFIQHKIGKLVTAILLTIVFYIFLTPIALLAGIFKKKPTKKENSALIDRDFTYDKKSFENTF